MTKFEFRDIIADLIETNLATKKIEVDEDSTSFTIHLPDGQIFEIDVQKIK